MQTTLTTTHGRHDHPPHSPESVSIRRVGAVDRLALHLGVALIKWGRRPLAAESRERRATRVEHLLASRAREYEAERMLRLTVPRR
jgi:hypothetical protein